MIYFPEEKFRLTYENRYPWPTKSLKHLIKEKHKLSTESTLDPTNIQLRNKYKKCRTHLYSNQLEINKSDLSKSWKIIKDITGLSNSKPNSTCFNINGIITTDKLKIAQAFNISSHYSKFGRSLLHR